MKFKYRESLWAHLYFSTRIKFEPFKKCCIWAIAPYLPNGSVPTLADLLDSSKRLAFWKPSFSNTTDYDFEKMGRPYEVHTDGSATYTFKTNLMGMRNQEYYYGDGLTEEERVALIE